MFIKSLLVKINWVVPLELRLANTGFKSLPKKYISFNIGMFKNNFINNLLLSQQKIVIIVKKNSKDYLGQ